MTDEEINRKFDVVAGHLATLTVSVQHVSDKVDRTADAVSALLSIAEIQSQEIRDLGAAVRSVDERQRETRENLNALINTVERYISEGRNGKG
jgi:methyl-accepting chemotaxis protein